MEAAGGRLRLPPLRPSRYEAIGPAALSQINAWADSEDQHRRNVAADVTEIEHPVDHLSRLDEGIGAVPLDQQVSGAVDVEIRDHPMLKAIRRTAALATRVVKFLRPGDLFALIARPLLPRLIRWPHSCCLRLVATEIPPALRRL
jgi:hypothetical protein